MRNHVENRQQLQRQPQLICLRLSNEYNGTNDDKIWYMIVFKGRSQKGVNNDQRDDTFGLVELVPKRAI